MFAYFILSSSQRSQVHFTQFDPKPLTNKRAFNTDIFFTFTNFDIDYNKINKFGLGSGQNVIFSLKSVRFAALPRLLYISATGFVR